MVTKHSRGCQQHTAAHYCRRVRPGDRDAEQDPIEIVSRFRPTDVDDGDDDDDDDDDHDDNDEHDDEDGGLTINNDDNKTRDGGVGAGIGVEVVTW